MINTSHGKSVGKYHMVIRVKRGKFLGLTTKGKNQWDTTTF